MRFRRWGALALAMGSAVHAADRPGTPIAPPPLPRPGAGPTVSAEPSVARPPTRSCTVTLFAAQEFVGDALRPIAFAPPPDCPGPWAKVVIESDGQVSAGEQFDRTGYIDLDGVNLFAGTTMEPRRALAPAWHAERDVTDYAALFAAPHAGAARLSNYVDARYTGRITWSARLVFYAADAAHPAPGVPDLVVPIVAAPATIDAAHPAIERDVTLPRNVERLMIDVLAVPQADDEFWYACTPDAAVVRATPAKDKPCGAPFRESEVRIDGDLAGFAPVYPWIYAGGMDPALWDTIPGIETLALASYRVDLTPFAGRLDDGRAHRVSVAVAGVRRYVVGTAALLAWRDPHASVVGGGVDRNTLAPAALAVRGTMRASGEGEAEAAHGRVVTRAGRDGVVVGHVDTSHGRVTTRLRQAMRFVNRQRGGGQGGATDQQATLATWRRVDDGAGLHRDVVRERFPLRLRFRHARAGAMTTDTTRVHQGLVRSERIDGGRGGWRFEHLAVDPVSRTTITGHDRATRRRVGESVTRVRIRDRDAGCYDRRIAVKAQKVVQADDRCHRKDI